jgi:Fe-S cluster assembly ATP-binding protein
MRSLKIETCTGTLEDKTILNDINININEGEVHVILGPNGVGKSTLCQAIMGNRHFNVTGKIILNEEDITALEVDDRARKGLFMAFQNPIEFDGLIISEYLKAAQVSVGIEQNFIKHAIELSKNLKKLSLSDSDAFRYLNYGFSGGQKKKLEILQLKMLKPSFALLDEIDSGLDVDSLKIVANNIVEEIKSNNIGLLIITHHNKIFDYIKPSHVHVLYGGKIVVSGDHLLIDKIQEEGYEWLKNI